MISYIVIRCVSVRFVYSVIRCMSVCFVKYCSLKARQTMVGDRTASGMADQVNKNDCPPGN